MAGMPPTEFDKRLGKRLREARVAAELSQHDMASAIGVSAAQFQKYENGRNRISASALQVCAGMLCMSPAHFFDPCPYGPTPRLQEAVVRLREVLNRLDRQIDGAHA